MGLETGTYISDLVATNPTSGDPKTQGDDHLRLIKSVLQATIPYTGKFYETGTFTPALKFGGASVGMTYSYQTGVYTRNGNAVSYTINILLTAKGSSTGNATLAGLPFTSSASANTSASAAIYGNGLTSISGAMVGLIVPSTSSVILLSTGTGSAANLTEANFNNNSTLTLSGVFFI